MKKNIITTIVTLSIVSTLFAGCGNSEPTKTDTKSDPVVVSESTEIISEDTENISEDSEIVSENTEVVVAAGDEVVFDDRGNGVHPKYENIGFKEYSNAYFRIPDDVHEDIFHASDINYNYLLTINNLEENDGTNISDLNEYVEYLKKLNTEYVEKGVLSNNSNFELLIIGDENFVKVTTEVGEYVNTQYWLPINLNGYYVHEGKYSYVSFTTSPYSTEAKVDEKGFLTEEGVVEALEVLHY